MNCSHYRSPFPDNEKAEGERCRGLSRAVRSRVNRRVGWQDWANAGVRSMNDDLQAERLRRRPEVVRLRCSTILWTNFAMLIVVVSAVECNNAAEAFKMLCSSVPGYTGNGVKQATYKDGLVALPDPGGRMADGSALLTGSDLRAWRDWRRILLRSPSKLQGK